MYVLHASCRRVDEGGMKLALSPPNQQGPKDRRQGRSHASGSHMVLRKNSKSGSSPNNNLKAVERGS